MAYGIIKVDTIIFDQGGADQNVTVSGIYRAITSGVTVSGTISGAVLVGTTTVSGTTVTGTTANFVSGVFTTVVSGATVTGTQSSFTSGNFVTLSGATATFTSGVIASGTVTDPSLSIVGDGNTGIYSPGADQLAVATNGTARLVIDANGTVTCTSAQPTDGSIRISNTTTRAPSNKYGIRFADSASETNAAIYAEQASSGNNASALVFGTNEGTGGGVLTSATERLRITSAGLVGIGTSSPAAALDIGGTFQSVRTYLSSVTDTYHLYRGTPDSAGFEHARVFSGRDTSVHTYGSYLAFYTEGKSSGTTDTSVERLRIDSSGRVGIGTASPSSTLHVVGSQFLTGGNYFTDTTSGYFFNGSGGFAGGIFGSSSGNIANIVSPQTITLSTASSERARIDSSGRLLVGTSSSSDSSKFIVQGNSVDPTGGGISTHANGKATPVDGEALGIIRFSANNHVEACSIMSARDGGTWTAGSSQPTRLTFSTTADGAASPTERMRIDSAGRVAINATPTVHQFLVEHNGRDGIAITDLNASSVQANLLLSNTRAGGTSNYYVLAYANNVNTFIVYSNGNIQNTNNSYGAISDIKLKENIVDATSQWSDIKALQVRKYNFKKGQTHTQIGLVAQEVELVSPGLVAESPDRDEDGNDLGTVTKSVNYSVLYMKAVKALQEAMERIETLEARLTAAGIE